MRSPRKDGTRFPGAGIKARAHTRAKADATGTAKKKGLLMPTGTRTSLPSNLMKSKKGW